MNLYSIGYGMVTAWALLTALAMLLVANLFLTGAAVEAIKVKGVLNKVAAFMLSMSFFLLANGLLLQLFSYIQQRGWSP